MALSSSILKRLSQVSILQGLGPAELEEIALMCSRKKQEANGKFNFIEEEVNSFCIVNYGTIIIRVPDSSGHGEIIGKLSSCNYFGEISAIDSEEELYDVFAGPEETEILIFSQKDFLEILQNYPSIHLALSREFCRRLRVSKRASSFISIKANVRIANTLLSLANREGTLVNEGIVLPKFNQKDLEKVSDSSSEEILSTLKELKSLGLIKPTEKKQILLCNKDEFQAWINEQ